jgi:hypothetical protein
MINDRQNFIDGQVLKSEHLNKIEDRIDSVVEVCVKNTDYATDNNGGVVKVKSTYGTGVIGSNGQLFIVAAEEGAIDARTSRYKPITPAYLDYAIKACTNQDSKAELTEEQLKLPPSTQFIIDYINEIIKTLK